MRGGERLINQILDSLECYCCCHCSLAVAVYAIQNNINRILLRMWCQTHISITVEQSNDEQIKKNTHLIHAAIRVERCKVLINGENVERVQL